MAKLESICLHCGQRIVYSKSIFFEDHERWYHPGNVTEGNGGRFCKDGQSPATPVESQADIR